MSTDNNSNSGSVPADLVKTVIEQIFKFKEGEMNTQKEIFIKVDAKLEQFAGILERQLEASSALQQARLEDLKFAREMKRIMWEQAQSIAAKETDPQKKLSTLMSVFKYQPSYD